MGASSGSQKAHCSLRCCCAPGHPEADSAIEKVTQHRSTRRPISSENDKGADGVSSTGEDKDNLNPGIVNVVPALEEIQKQFAGEDKPARKKSTVIHWHDDPTKPAFASGTDSDTVPGSLPVCLTSTNLKTLTTGSATSNPSILGTMSVNSWRQDIAMAAPCHFPVNVLGMARFMELEVMRPHEEIRHLLHQPDNTEILHFISHEWLGFSHPDPDGTQLQRMQSIFRTIAEGNAKSLFADADFEGFLKGVSSGTGRHMHHVEGKITSRAQFGAEDVVTHVTQGSVWLDYHSIPQDTQKASFKDAVQSIPHYVERSDYFWVCAPRGRHRELKEVRDFASWRGRGWCRFEEVINLLSKVLKMPLIVTNATHVQTYGFLDAIQMFFGRPDRSVANGNFTCCRLGHMIKQKDGTTLRIPCDKDTLGPILAVMYKSVFEHGAKEAFSKFKQNMLKSAAYGIFAGFETEYAGLALPHGLAQEAFLNDIGFADLDARDQIGFPPLLWAVSFGDMQTAADLVRERPEQLFVRSIHKMSVLIRGLPLPADDFKKLLWLHENMRKEEELNHATNNGYTAVDRACKFGFPHNLRTLLELRASMSTRRKDNDATPILSAAMEGYDECCALLLEFRADVHAVDARKRTILHLAANPMTTLGNSAPGCRVNVLKLGLEAGVDKLAKDDRGMTALQIAYQHGSVEIADILEEALGGSMHVEV